MCPDSDKRRSKRLMADFTLTYQVDQPLNLRIDAGWKADIVALMFDLSEYGMAVSTNYNIPVRTLLQIKFTLINLNAPAEDQVKSMQITAEVKSNIQVDKDEYRLGLSFAEIKEEDRLAIAQFVKESSFRKKDG